MVLLNQAVESIERYSISKTMQQMYSQTQPPPPTMKMKDPKLHAAQKHRLAEQNRRNRISGQYATLRAILPNLSKTEKTKFKKAFILCETIRRVKELKKVASEKRGGNREMIPSGGDRLSIEQCDRGVEGTTVKAVISCEDRQGMMGELGKALKTMKMKVVKAEMVTVGGRNKFALWMEGPKEGPPGAGLKRALEAVMRKPSWTPTKPRSSGCLNNYGSSKMSSFSLT